jgi:glutaredoxin
MTIKIFTSKNCKPCQEVDRLIKEGKFEGDIQVVDIETDEGFEEFRKEILEKGDGAVPSAYRDGQKCIISITEDDSLIFKCSVPPAESEPGK